MRNSLICFALVFFLFCVETNLFALESFAEPPSQPEKFTDPKKSFDKVVSVFKEKYFDETITDEEIYQYAVEGSIAGLNRKMGPKYQAKIVYFRLDNMKLGTKVWK
jgi:hypothetical protein